MFVKMKQSYVTKWWLPDKVIFVSEIPHTSVGKFDKKLLRINYEMSSVREPEQVNS